MGWKPLCSNDPLLDALQQVYKAIPLRSPATNVQPLQVIRSDGSQTDRLGSLNDALAGTGTINVPLQTAKNIDALAHSSRKINLSLGLDILGPFLKAFGLSTIGLDTAFDGASEVSFSFTGVERTYVEALALGKAMRGQRLDVENPALMVFADPASPWGFYVIDSILTSPNISVKVETSADASFKLNVPAIQQILGNVKAGVSVSSADGRQLSVTGSVPLTFAFSVFQFYLDDGKVASIDPGAQIDTFGFAAAQDADAPKRVLLTDKPAMLSWDASA